MFDESHVQSPYFSRRFLFDEFITYEVLQQNDKFVYDDAAGICFLTKELRAVDRCRNLIARASRHYDVGEGDSGDRRMAIHQKTD